MGGYKIYHISLSLGGRRQWEPGSRDDAVLVVLRVLPLPLAFRARHRVVRDVRYPHAAVRSPSRQRVRLRRRGRRGAGTAVAIRVFVSHFLPSDRLVGLERFVVVPAEPDRPPASRLPPFTVHESQLRHRRRMTGSDDGLRFHGMRRFPVRIGNVVRFFRGGSRLDLVLRHGLF